MKTQTDRAESRETVNLVIRFIDAALRYRFLYVQNRTDGPRHVGAVLDSIQKAHTNAQALLRTIEACGLPASESHDAWRLLSIGLTDASYADCERALKNWAKAATEAAKPVEPAKRRTGRLNKTESDTKKAELLAACSAHPTLMNDFPALARNIGISEDTCRRWLNDFNKKHSGKPKP